MAKSIKRNKAQKLRKSGRSIREITQQLGVSKSTVSLWCRDVKLTSQQTKALERRMLEGFHRGRMKAAQLKQAEKAVRIARMQQEGRVLLSNITRRDLFLLGLGLYWGEGTKSGLAKFSNSNLVLLKLFIRWLEDIWGIPRKQLSFLLLINEKHRTRIQEVLRYWCRTLRVSENQFTKPVLIKAKTQKNYNDFPKYYGTIQVRAKKSTNLLYKIHGIFNAIAEKMAR